MPVSKFRRSRTLLILAAATAATLAASAAEALGKPDFDIRGPRATTLAAPPAPLPPGQQRALDDLRAGGAVELRWSALTGAPSRIHLRGKPLTLPSAAPPRAIAASFLGRYRELLGLTPEDLRDLRSARDFRTGHNGAHHLTLQQQVEGRDVFGGRLRVNIDGQGRILGVSGEPIPNAQGKVNVLEPTLSERDALAQAAAEAGIQRARRSEAIELVWFPLDGQTLRLAWHVYVEDDETPDGYDTLVDAVDGTVLWRKNRTLYSHVAAHGLVFPSDSPQPHTPRGTLYDDVQDDLPFHGGLLFPHGDPHFDWWAGVTPRDTTTGNNADAFLDRDNDDAPDGSCSSCGDGAARPDAPTEDFSYPLADPETVDPSDYQDAALTNAFYWANRTHDFFYRLGFDEAAGNFQADNFGLGGSGGDAVRVNVQDGADLADPPYCNANMNTDPDGNPPRLQLYLCDNESPLRDSALDAMTMTHEYSHGVHSRLLSLGGRQNPQEGICDFFALSQLAEPADPYGGAYGYGGQWARGITSGDGIRSAPYSTDPSIFPRTYADINDASVCNLGTCSNAPATNCDASDDCPAGGSCQKSACLFDTDCTSPPMDIPRGPCTVSVHHTGELWANALWIGRMNLIEKYGFAAGGRRMSQLAVDGMKLSADDPSMLDGRDAILSADEINFAGVDVCLLWSAFAQMGMGYSALTTGNDDLNPLEAFDLPAECTPLLQVNAPDDFGNVCVGGFEELQLAVYNTGAGELVVSSITRTAGSTDITVDPLPATPVVIGADSHVDFTVQCTPTSPGEKTATITVATNDPAQPTLDLEYSCNGGRSELVTTIQPAGDFGLVCLGTFHDLDLTLQNSGTCDLTVTGITSSDPEFEVGTVQSYPIVVAAGDTVLVPVRFEPTDGFGVENAVFTVATNDPDDPTHEVAATASVQPGDINVPAAGTTQDFGNVCAAETSTMEIPVCNTGACNLNVAGASIDCDDFTIVGQPFPAVVSPDFCIPLTVRYTPTEEGTHTCTLTITSDDPDESPVTVTLTATTPGTVIDVPPDQAFLPEVVSSVDVCEQKQPFPISNNGLCPLEITSIAIVDNGAEFGLEGVPSFPILLQSGHVAGEGDLRTIFGPDQPLDRDKLGTLRVTYVSDAVAGTTTDVDRTLCGEAVLTGARVLVTYGGAPVDLVDRIQIQRVVGNRNRRPQLDTVSVAQNLALQSTDPADPCGSFQWHQEYGTVSNPIQLLPGFYQVTATIKVGNRKLTKTVGFSVNSCDFNPSVVVTF